MRSFIIFLLLCVLPLQFVLAADVDARLHAGSHHHHHHDATPHSHEIVNLVASDFTDSDESTPRNHGECGTSHCAHSPAMLATRAEFKPAIGIASLVLMDRDAQLRSAAAERPERPNWSALV